MFLFAIKFYNSTLTAETHIPKESGFLYFGRALALAEKKNL